MRGAVLAFVFSFGLFATLVSQAPIGLALAAAQDAGLSAEGVSGTIWNGRLTKVRLGGLTAPQARVRLDPSALLHGEVRMLVEAGETRAVLVGGASRGVASANLSADLTRLGFSLPLPGAVRLDRVTLLFGPSGCSEAHGRVLSNAFQKGWQGPQLVGAVSCERGAAVARLSGADAASRAEAALTLQADGRYRLRSWIVTGDEALKASLALAGFKPSGAGLERYDEGRLAPT